MSSRNSRKHALVRSSFFPSGKHLGHKTASGASLALIGVAIRFIVTTGSTAVLARLLSPGEFGEMAMAMIVTDFTVFLGNFGLQSILVQKRRVCRLDLDTTFWASMALGVTLMSLVLFASLFVGEWFHNDHVAVILRFAALFFVFEQLRHVHLAILYRLMLFKLDFYIQTFGLIVRTGAALTLAWSGFGVLSLVFGPLIGHIVLVILCWTVVPYWPRARFNLSFLTHNLRIAASYLGDGFLFYCNTNLDLLVLARLLGATELGYYQLCRSLTDELRSRITTPLQRVLFPAYALLQTEQERFQQAVVRSTRMLAFIIAPMGIGMAATAKEIVLLLFGERWLPMAPILPILALAGALRATLAVAGPIFNAVNKADVSLRFNTVNIIFFFLAIAYGSQWGAQGVALGSLASALMFSLVALGGYRQIGLGARDLLCALSPPYLAGALMFSTVAVIRHYTWPSADDSILLYHADIILTQIRDNLQIYGETFAFLGTTGVAISSALSALGVAIGDSALLHFVVLVATGIVSYIIGITLFSRALLHEVFLIIMKLSSHKQ